jgi:hypothetical protein
MAFVGWGASNTIMTSKRVVFWDDSQSLFIGDI